MKRLFYTLLFFLPCMLIACGGSDDTPDGDNNPPVVAPPCEEPVDSRLLYSSARTVAAGTFIFVRTGKRNVTFLSVG